jgi:protein SCO1
MRSLAHIPSRLRLPRFAAATVLAFAATIASSGAAGAQVASDVVARQMEGVDVVQRLGAEIPRDLPFRDADGNAVVLGDYFRDGRPVLLTLNYSDCPVLCVLQLDGLATAMAELDWRAGEHFQVLTVSIDDKETPAKARARRELYLERYGKAAPGGWEFLVGDRASIDALAQAVGFGYRYDPESGHYAHDAVLVMATPSGVVSRYVLSILFDPVSLRMSLVEVSEGKLGSLVDRVLGFCFQYDASSGSHVVVAQRVMYVAMGIMAAALGGYLLFLSRYRAGHSSGKPPHAGSGSRGTRTGADTAQAIS